MVYKTITNRRGTFSKRRSYKHARTIVIVILFVMISCLIFLIATFKVANDVHHEVRASDHLEMNPDENVEDEKIGCRSKQDEIYANGLNGLISKSKDNDNLARERRAIIHDAMTRTWNTYRKYAWGRDELLPKSLTGSDHWARVGATLVDSLDTLWLLGMKEEFYEGRD